MSRSTDQERRRLWGGTAEPSRSVSDGLTVGNHPAHAITADSPEAARIKQGIVYGDGVSRDIRDGLTYGDPQTNAAREAEWQGYVQEGAALNARDDSERAELSVRREVELLENAAYAINEAGALAWREPTLNARAAGFWEVMTTEQRGMLVLSGEVDEDVADQLHTAVWPAVVQAKSEHNVAQTHAAGLMQKATFLLRLREERGNPDDAAWHEHQRAVFAKAHEKGLDLGDDNLGSMQFENEFRAAEVVLAEDARADAEARFKVDLLNTPTTNVSEGLRVLTAGGWESTIEAGPVMSKPDYAKAAARVLGGGNGDPMHDDANEIRAGILGATTPTEDVEWRQTQEAAGKLFSDAEEARIRVKLGEG